MHKLRVGVLMGGKSIEKEVSFNSGRTICDHLDTTRYNIIPIFQTHDNLYALPWHFLHRGKITDFEHRLTNEAEHIAWDDLKKLVDFVYIATHGRFAEDGTLQGFLEILGIPYLGSGVFASALRMDKIMQKTFLVAAGISVPNYITVNPHDISLSQKNINLILQKLAANNIQLPCVIKPYNEGSSLGIEVVFDEKKLAQAMHAACIIDPHKKKRVLIEEKVSGMEFSCITLVDYKTGNFLPLPPTEIVLEANTHLFDYAQKYMPGKATKFTPARCSQKLIKKIQDTCIQTMETLEFTTISRIDGFLTFDEQVVIVDPNTLSGMAPSSFIFNQAAKIDMSHTQLINYLIETELHQYGILEKIIKQEQKENIMQRKKINVTVLFGGQSNEKEISLESGRNITYKLSPQKYNAIPIFVNNHMELYKINQSQLVSNSTKEITHLIDEKQKIKWDDLPHIADFVFNGLHGGVGENGTVQGALEMLGIAYNGSSVLTSALCMDKYKTTQFLHAHGFDVPRNLLITKDSWKKRPQHIIKNIQKHLTFPTIIKPSDDGCSIMVHKVYNEKKLVESIETLFTNNKNTALVEEFIAGMELSVGIIGNDKPCALPPSQTIAKEGILSIEEKFLPGAGENQTPAPLPKKTLLFVQQTVEKVYATLQCKGYARIDCFYQTTKQSPTGKQRIIILEVNTLPGMTPATCIFHQAAEIGFKPMDFIDTIIQLGLEEHSKQATKVIKTITKYKKNNKSINL